MNIYSRPERILLDISRHLRIDSNSAPTEISRWHTTSFRC